MIVTGALRARRRRLVRQLTDVALILSLVTGGLELHRHVAGGADHDLGLEARLSYDPAAAHPGQPKHFEASGETKRPPCTACLHSLALRGLHLPTATALRVDPQGACLPVACLSERPSDPFLHGVGGRSPPLA
jgi:hypothetical protein